MSERLTIRGVGAGGQPGEEGSLNRIDTHTHPKISKRFSFDPTSVHRMVRMANGKDFGTEIMLLVQARALGLPIVAGSDAHHWLQLGVRHSFVHTHEIGTAAVIKAIKEGLTGYGVGAYTPVRVSASKWVKNITKLLRKSRGVSWTGNCSWGTWPRSQAPEKPLAG